MFCISEDVGLWLAILGNMRAPLQLQVPALKAKHHDSGRLVGQPEIHFNIL